MASRPTPGGIAARSVASAVRGVPTRVSAAVARAVPAAPLPTIDSVAHQRAAHDIAGLLAGLPSAATITQPYTQAGQQVDAQTQSLVDQLRGEQTYRVNLATGLPQAVAAGDTAIQSQADQSAARLGGTATALPSTAAAGTLASFGTSAANQVAQQQVTAPLVGMQYHAALNQGLLKALNDRQLQVDSANAKLPSLEDQYRSELTTQQQAADQLGFQKYVANRNYDLAAGRTKTQAEIDRERIAAENARAAATAKAAGDRAAAGRANQWRITQARITASAQNAAANRDATSQRAAAATAKQRASTLGRTQQYIDKELQTRYAAKPGTGGAVSGYDVAYSYVDANDNQKTGTKHVTPEQYQAFKSKGAAAIGLPSGASITGTTPRKSSGTPGRPVVDPNRATDWAKGYIARQNTAYGWGLSQAEITRLAQQSVRDSGIWPKYARQSHPNTPGVPQARARGRAYGRRA